MTQQQAAAAGGGGGGGGGRKKQKKRTQQQQQQRGGKKKQRKMTQQQREAELKQAAAGGGGEKKEKQKKEKVPSIPEPIRLRLTRALDDFRNSSDPVFTFEAGLTNDERAVVHSLCRKRGMKSKSSGKGDQRRLSVYNNKRSVDTTKKDNFTSFTFSEEAKDILRDLFTRYPPDDRDMGEKMDGKPIGKPENRKKDDFFYKPSMNKVEIARKVESLASVVEKTPKLRQINQARSKLPIASFRDVITSTIESHQVVLISGETGCGKTTQVPQYLLDYMWDKGETCKIVCTQPRRISAISVAERISSERGETVGDSVGYKIRLESKGGRNSSVVFCTNGVLLRVLVSKGTDSVERKASRTMGKDDVSDITHIIVDEIHERDRFSDLMLAILRDTLPSYPHLRLVLMSATLDAERFSQYFGGCPIIRVPGFTYPVQSFYLEDVLSLLKSTESNHPDFTSSSVKIEETKLTKEDRVALDEAIDLAWSDDEFDPIVDLISSGGSDVVNFQHSSSGVTPLMAFARKGRVNDICMLLSFGADCHARAKDGTTAVEWAQRENQREAVEILEKHMDKAFASSEEEKDLLDKYLSTTKPEEINVVLIESLLKKICTNTKDGAILIFLPGWDDINKTRDRLQAGSFKDSSKFVIISLHSMVPSVEQKKVFKRPPHGCRKIVLSTNIAETAVTIDDVVYVIDSGRMKEKNYDPYNNVSTLNSSWISKASAKQREGRAGRCQPGVCYHLYSKLRAASLIDFQVPEIRRIPIEELCLQVKILDPDCKIDEFLQKTLDPPISETIRNAITVLQDIGALSPDEKLTDLGNKIGSLPVHPLTSKMLFVAILTNCLDPALTLACASDYKDSFTLPILPSQKKKAEAAKFELSLLYGGYSDQLAIVAAFECWKNAKAKGQEPKFCSLYYVSSGTMKMLFKMRMQLQSELHRNGFIPDDASVCNVNAHNPGILRTVLVAGQYPMVGRLVPKSGGQRSVVETAGGNKVRLHPHSTNFMLAFKNSDDRPLIIHDEVTRVDSGLLIRNCSLIGPLPLLMLATEIIVAPDKENEYDGGDHNEGGSEEADEDNCDESKPSVRGQEIIMSTPHNPVKVIVDRWLSFESTAIDVAQIYCLRERLSKAIMHKVTHPRKDFPELLGASIKAITAILSSDAMLGIRPTTMATTGGNGQPVTKGTDQNPSRFLESLIRPSLPQNSALNHTARRPEPTGMENLNYPSNPHSQPPSSAAFAGGPYQNYPAGAVAGLHQNYPAGAFVGLQQNYPAGAFAGQHQNYPAGAFASPPQNYPAGAFAGAHQNHTAGSFASPHQNFHAGAFPESDQNLPAGTLNSYQIIYDALAYLSQVSSGAAPFPSEFFSSHGPTLVSGPMPGVDGTVAPSSGPTPPRAGGSLKRRRCNKS